jgi:hypothetical protein
MDLLSNPTNHVLPRKGAEDWVRRGASTSHGQIIRVYEVIHSSQLVCGFFLTVTCDITKKIHGLRGWNICKQFLLKVHTPDPSSTILARLLHVPSLCSPTFGIPPMASSSSCPPQPLSALPTLGGAWRAACEALCFSSTRTLMPIELCSYLLVDLWISSSLSFHFSMFVFDLTIVITFCSFACSPFCQ